MSCLDSPVSATDVAPRTCQSLAGLRRTGYGYGYDYDHDHDHVHDHDYDYDYGYENGRNQVCRSGGRGVLRGVARANPHASSLSGLARASRPACVGA